MFEYPKDIGTGLVPVSRFVPCRTFRWRHIYGSFKTSYWDLPLVPAPFFLPLQSISYLEPLAARGVSLNVPSLGVHAAACSFRHHSFFGLSRSFPSIVSFWPGHFTSAAYPRI